MSDLDIWLEAMNYFERINCPAIAEIFRKRIQEAVRVR